MTQDLGTAKQRIDDFPEIEGMVYTVGNEQDYHFKVLFKILKRLGYKWANNLFHLSYGMVDLSTLQPNDLNSNPNNLKILFEGAQGFRLDVDWGE